MIRDLAGEELLVDGSKYKLEQAVKLTTQLKPVRLEGMLLERIPDYTFLEER